MIRDMGCLNCDRAKAATFYNRFVGKVGHGPITMLMSTAYYAGLRPTTTGIRVTFEEGNLTMSSTIRDTAVSVRKGSNNVMLTYKGNSYQLTVPEHAGFIIEGKHIPGD